MALLSLPQNKISSIACDYADKHAGSGAVFFFTKYPKTKNSLVNDGRFQAKKLAEGSAFVNFAYSRSEENKNDVYASINSYKNVKGVSKRTKEYLESLDGLFFDLDYRKAHDEDYFDRPEEILAYKDILTQALFTKLNELKVEKEAMFAFAGPDLSELTLDDKIDMIVPNDSDFGMPNIAFSGAGFALHFSLSPICPSELNIFLYKKTASALAKLVAEALAEADLIDKFEVDSKVIGDISRVARVIGTYNSRTRTNSEYIARFGKDGNVYRYSLNDLIDVWNLDLCNEDTTTGVVKDSHLLREKETKEELGNDGTGFLLCPSNRVTKIGNIISVSTWAKTSCKTIETHLRHALRALEIKDSKYQQTNDASDRLYRNNSLFMIACLRTELTCKRLGIPHGFELPDQYKRSIAQMISELNSTIYKPLDADEISNLLKSASSNIYHFRKHETMASFLNMTESEFAEAGFYEKKNREQAKKERNIAATENIDKKIAELYLAGFSDARIAKELSISKQTSINCRKRLGLTNRNIAFNDINFEDKMRHINRETIKTACDIIEIPSSATVQYDLFEKVADNYDAILNDAQTEAYNLILSGVNTLITAKAGTGKSYLFKVAQEELTKRGKTFINCALTAQAAANIGGVTIHHLFNFAYDYKFGCGITNATIEKLAKYDTIFIDEIGMVSAEITTELLRLAWRVYRFTGHHIQFVFAGDPCQLKPPCGEYFFESAAFRNSHFNRVSLTENMRQSDDVFDAQLSKARVGDVSCLSYFNQHISEDPNALYVYPYKESASIRNAAMLSKLPGNYISVDSHFSAKIEAQVIVTKNGKYKNGKLNYYNGMRGILKEVRAKSVILEVNGKRITMKPQKLVDSDGAIYEGFPLELGYAMTIHKVQGMTLDAININPKCFEAGQFYTAVSRVRTADGLHLLSKVKEEYIITDEKALLFDKKIFDIAM